MCFNKEMLLTMKRGEKQEKLERREEMRTGEMTKELREKRQSEM